MTRIDWPAINTRARGLALHLLRRADLEDLAASSSLSLLAHRLGQHRDLIPSIPESGQARDFDRAVRRAMGTLSGKLSLWSPRSRGALEVFFAEVDRRSLRALLRGSASSVPSDARLAGLLPTPRLPERVLTELARQNRPSEVVGQLILLGFPGAAQLRPVTLSPQPDLFDVELALARMSSTRMRDAARSGDANLETFVREQIDVANGVFAILLASHLHEAAIRTCFLEGGQWLSLEDFLEVATRSSRREASSALRRRLRKSPVGRVFSDDSSSPAHMDDLNLAASLERQARARFTDPLGSAPALHFLLRLRAQTMDLARLAWGVSMGAPKSLITGGFVTPWT